MRTDDLLQEIDLPDEISTPLQAFRWNMRCCVIVASTMWGPRAMRSGICKATNRARFWSAEAPALRSGLA